MNVTVFVLGVVGISALLWGGPWAAFRAEDDEQFMPVGQSPGLSGKYTVIGTVQAVNVRDQTVTIAGPSGTRSAKVTERTRIWLDRSKIQQPNVKGTFADLRTGATVEVKHEDPTRASAGGPAEWIKIQIARRPEVFLRRLEKAAGERGVDALRARLGACSSSRSRFLGAPGRPGRAVDAGV